jgi:demethylmenaquinone methyltransferase/2-methoxy-6-polyprenyl-1,4-benzoquinol methylase
MLVRGVAKGLGRDAAPAACDGLRLPFATATFDAVSAAFGVRNFENLAAGLGEMRRVVRPGGRLVVLEFFARRENPLLRFYLGEIMPRIGRWISRSPTAYAYLRDSTRGFLGPDEFAAKLDALGFAPVVVRRLSWGIAHCVVATKPPIP